MIIRIVKLSFKPETIDTFLLNFEKNKNKVRNSKGCSFLELYQDKKDTNVFFTYSYWNSEEDLNNYRNSIFFKELWAVFKADFNDKPQAWSVNKLDSLA